MSAADPLAILSARFVAAIRAAFPDLNGEIDPLVTVNKNAALGDFQSNAAMGLSKRIGKPPREIAQAIVAKLELSDIAEPFNDKSIAGPGFINITLKSAALAASLVALDTPGLGVEQVADATIVVDVCGVNLAKQAHIGHLRSIVIGDALARTFERQGIRVIRQNHVGDWGLPIAMVTGKLMAEQAAGRLNPATLTLDRLEKLYKRAQQECERDLAGLEAVKKFGLGPKALAEVEEQVHGATEAFTHARQTLVRLQSQDPATIAVWKAIYDCTMSDVLAVCKRLHANVTNEATAGESSYADELGPLVDDLVNRKIAEESDGALVVFVQGTRTGEDGQPIREACLVRKSDGGYLYATTDLAAIRRRVQKLGAGRVVYAVDARQAQHFDQVFKAATRAGYATILTGKDSGAVARMDHAAFGTVLGKDGKPFKTRSGESVKLNDVIEEAVQKALAEVASRNTEMPASQQREIAEVLGVAALKYADLSNDRVKDYVFDFDRMVAFEGNTGPYLLNALVRIKSIFRKASEKGVDTNWKGALFAPNAPQEKTLALALLRYPGVIEQVADTLEPHRMCGYLYDVASAFASFYEACPVLKDDVSASTRDARLRLCDLTGRILSDGLVTLGIPPLERM
ncbi:MAG: arginine--tRNA ligase [Planctomycetes bacterium]|nr:arginine--tRNA ligase [Planctomycetota bacterium]